MAPMVIIQTSQKKEKQNFTKNKRNDDTEGYSTRVI